MVLSVLKPPATFIAGLREIPKVDKESCKDFTGLTLGFGFVWVGDGMFESSGEVEWIAELLEGSEDWKEACAVMAWVLPQLRSAVVATGQLPMTQVIALGIAF